MQSGALRMKGFVPPTKRPRSAGLDGGIIMEGSVGMNSSLRQKFRKGDRTRRMWTPREEEILAATLLELVARGNPHVNSKISAWKKSYGYLQNILSRTGGGGAEQLDGAAAGARSQQSGGSQSNDNYYYPSFDNFSPGSSVPLNDIPDVNDHVSGQSEQGTSANKASSLKGKNDSGDTAMMEFLANLHSETNARLEVISSRIGSKFDLAKAREDVFEKLCTVDGLTIAQRYQLCNILGDKPQWLHIFTGMPEAARLGYVLMLIDENHRGI
ncbi:hypothetical protein SASPL_126709 [Salvia splendens]|uniref:Myb/SANT-like domain-containing protein n=1 Tax=Salvia splendens TaxID=180675 RepID=A0A8X8XI66_SALSN|nr:hypothetical protein SASPL_126709 [Salvia splendens]